MRRYRISGGDNGAYGPAFGPVCADEIATLAGDDGLLLRLPEPLTCASEPVRWLAIRPRYAGESVNGLRAKGGCSRRSVTRCRPS